MKKGILLVMVVALSFGLFGCGGGNAQAEAMPEDMMEQTEEVKEVPKIDAFGVVKVREMQNVKVDFNSKVEKVFVKAGEKVALNTELVELDLSKLNNELEDQKLDLEEKEYELSMKDVDVTKMINDLKVSRDNFQMAKDDYFKSKDLYAKNSISKEELDKKELTYKESQKNVTNMELSLSDTKNNKNNNDRKLINSISKAKRNISILEKKIQDANLKDGSILLSKVNNGVVQKLDVLEGDYLTNEIKIMTIMDLDTRYIETEIAEEFVKDVKVGQKVEVKSMANLDKVYTGSIKRIWKTSENRNGETVVPVEIEIDNLDDNLLVNFNVEVKIILEEN
ncbi:MAG: efflux RND transporter periplasmic adaptor subunit [Firmicutes bacterium]|jgi:multidrug resistance efflux pump|nr:efflux RND transporter periplasmic adaptor subunit [Bacillota bacterium]